MGQTISCCGGGSERHDVIAKTLHKAKKEDQKLVKLVLIGTGESGKTTIFNQVRITYEKELHENILDGAKEKIGSTLIEGANNLIQEVASHNLDYETEKGRIAAKKLFDLYDSAKGHQTFHITKEFKELLDDLVHDPPVKKLLESPFQLQIPDTWNTFMEKLKNYPAWGGPGWIPTKEEALQARVRTTGTTSIKFDIGKVKYALYDIGGQQSERSKWVMLLEGVTGVIFVAALSDYNLAAFEDRNTNRLTDSLTQWQKFVNMDTLGEAAFVLFLNKEDLLRRKFCEEGIPIELDAKMTYPADPPKYDKSISSVENFENAKVWFEELYLSKVQDWKKDSVYIYVTMALDNENVMKVINAVHVNVLKILMQDASFMP